VAARFYVVGHRICYPKIGRIVELKTTEKEQAQESPLSSFYLPKSRI
jgi:hypothetical protein